MTKFDRYALAAALAAAAALGGCGEGAPTRVCVDKDGWRTSDDQCATGAHGRAGAGVWYYINARAVREGGVPGVGDPARGGGFTPAAGVAYEGAPAGGISRGGFGGTGESVGGHGGGAGE